MDLETVKLSTIVMRFIPELYPFLTVKELNMEIALRDGFSCLEATDAVEIVQYSICEYQKSGLLH